MNNTPSKKDVDDLVYALRQKGDDSTYALVVEAIAKWGTPQPVVRWPLTTLTIAPVRRFLADRGIYLSDETTKELIVVAHGITQRGGSNGL